MLVVPGVRIGIRRWNGLLFVCLLFAGTVEGQG